MKQLISVIVPCFNQGEFLSDALQSVSDQTYSHWECIIIDDGSTDSTEAVSKKWCSKDERFAYYKKKNGGLSSARNLGLSKTRGKFLQFLDADDFLRPKKFQISLKEISRRSNGKESIAVTDFLMYFDEAKQYQPAYCRLEQEIFSYYTILFQWDETFSIPIHCAFFDKELFKSFRFPEDLRAKEDWIMWILLLQRDPHICYIDEPLAIYRKHRQSMTMSEGIFEGHMGSLEYLKNFINPEEYVRLLEVMVQRYYKATLRFKNELYKAQNNNIYKFDRFLLKLVKKIKMRISVNT